VSGEDEPPPPPGGKNYMTPAGHARLVAERSRLAREERPRIVEIVSWAAGNGDRSENGDYLYGKKRLREIDRRLRFLDKRLEIAEVVDPSRQAGGRNGGAAHAGGTGGDRDRGDQLSRGGVGAPRAACCST
jgi:hypothetical protein